VREDIFKSTIRNKSLHEINHDDGVIAVNSAMSKNLPTSQLYKYMWTSPDGKKHYQFDYVLIDKRWHSSIVNV
jgi:hypothetical protein